MRGKEPARMGLDHVSCSWIKMAQHSFACLWVLVFVFFSSRTCMFLYPYIFTYVRAFGFVSLCFPTCLSLHLLVHLQLSLNVCMCLYMTCIWMGGFACASVHIFLGFCMRMLLHVSACLWRSMTPMRLQTSLKCLASQRWNLMLENGWAGPLLRFLWLNNYFLPRWSLQHLPRAPSGCL